MSASADELDRATVAESAALLAQLRAAVPELGSDAAWDDVELFRFLIARRKHVDKAAKMLRDTLQWRKERKLDELKVFPDEGQPPLIAIRGYSWLGDRDPEVGAGPYAACLKAIGGFCWHKADKNGNPLYIERTGMHDASAFPKTVPMDTAIDWHINLNEFSFDRLLRSISKNTDQRVTKVTAILDLRGLGWHMFKLDALKYLQNFGKIDQDYYPERLYKVFVVNAPPVFTKFWAVLKIGLDKRVLEKVYILGTDYQKEVLKHIDEANLPDFLGGKCTCSHMSTGCVPCYQPERLADLDSVQKYIYPRDAFEEDIEVEEAGATLRYRFTTKDYNIAFGIVFRPASKDGGGNAGAEEVVEAASVRESHVRPVVGAIPNAKVGTYVFKWDNTSSLLRGKYLNYMIDLDLPIVPDASAELREDIKQTEAREALEDASIKE